VTVVAGQVWVDENGHNAVVVGLRTDHANYTDVAVKARLVVFADECITTTEIPCDELRARYGLVFDATLIDPWAVAA
jgi:hypothetical protein